jgi:hypothetical protein
MAMAALGGAVGGIAFLLGPIVLLFRPASVLAGRFPKWNQVFGGPSQRASASEAARLSESASHGREAAEMPDETQLIEWERGVVAEHRPGRLVVHLPARGIEGDTG